MGTHNVIMREVLGGELVYGFIDGLGAKGADAKAREIVLGKQFNRALARREHAQEGGPGLEHTDLVAYFHHFLLHLL